MTLRIISATDPIKVDTLCVMAYGDPGAGKTSLSFTADKPLSLDFDAGAHRSAFRKDSVRVQDWTEVASLDEADLEPYNTVIVDTAGRALDCLTMHLIKSNPKLGRSSGALTLPGFGELKAGFGTWVKRLRSYGKDVILLAHGAEEKNGDEMIIRPDMQGGSKMEVIKVADLIGYLHMVSGKRMIDFNPTDRWIGKNCASFDPLTIPDFHSAPDFLAKVIVKAKEHLNAESEQSQKFTKMLADYHTQANDAKDAEGINAMIDKLPTVDESARESVKGIIAKRAKTLELTFDKTAKKYTEKVAA